MLKHVFSLIFAVMIVCVVAAPVVAQENDPVISAADYLATMQVEDGGFSTGWTPESDLSTTADAVVALVAAEQSGDVLDAALAYLAAQVGAGNAASAGQIAKVITAVIALENDPADFGEHNLIDDLLALQSEEGIFGMGVFDHCLAMIALQNAAVDLPEGTVEALIAGQTEAGGWGFMAGEAPDTNTTGLCLQALALTGEADAVAASLDYLAAIQNEDGGWPYQSPSDYGTDSDTNSTALIVQSLIATGENLDDWHNPADWLLSMQNESGAFGYQAAMPDDNLVATVAVIPALAGLPLNSWALMAE
ncbi:MAG: terpene cyclase/mutase family protein [Anaerolineae bacterium]|nr:terpene cyclase/mutase family protein [Anaerolineae bacterium]